MITWEAHACLPLSPQADFAPLDEYRAAGVDYVSINVGMDMNPLSQVLAVIAAFRERIAAHPDRYLLASSVDDIERAAAFRRNRSQKKIVIVAVVIPPVSAGGAHGL